MAASAADLPQELLADIHVRLGFVDRLAFAAVFRASRHVLRPEAPWLVLPGESPETAALFSLAGRRAASVRVSAPALRDHAVLGSSGGRLVTADARGRMHLVNPVTGDQRALPEITTIPCLKELGPGSHFVFQLKPFLKGPPCDDPRRYGTYTLRADEMRSWLYHKVVLSAPADGGYDAMLITNRRFGAPAFARAQDAAWRLAPSLDGVEDAIHHNGRFYSIAYSGVVEAWEHDAGAGGFVSTVVAPPLGNEEENSSYRKYLVAAPCGRLMVVLKDSKETSQGSGRSRWTCSFKVLVLDDKVGAQWKEATDIGEAALFVGINSSMCVSTREHPEIKAGCVYFTDDELGRSSLAKARRYHYTSDNEDRRGVGMYSLKDGTLEKVEALTQHQSWPAPVWFTPSLP